MLLSTGDWRYSTMCSKSQRQRYMNGQLHDIDNLSHERSPYTHYTGVMVCPRASLNAVRNRKISFPCKKLNTISQLSCPQSAQKTDWAIQAPFDGKTILKWLWKKQAGTMWTTLIWLRIQMTGGLQWTWYSIFGLQKRQGVPWFEQLPPCLKECV